MKSILFAITLLATSILLNQANAALVSSSGWYYTQVNYYSGTPSFNHMGPYADKPACLEARAADYGNGGGIPWDGGPGCFYLYENEINAYNELLEHWGMAGGGDDGVPTMKEDIHKVLADVNVLIEQHAILEYRRSMNTLSNVRNPSKR